MLDISFHREIIGQNMVHTNHIHVHIYVHRMHVVRAKYNVAIHMKLWELKRSFKLRVFRCYMCLGVNSYIFEVQIYILLDDDRNRCHIPLQ
jgi:hypothetical protein